MKIFDTLNRELKEFQPRNLEDVKMFVCGPTVYDFSHIGHARTYIAFDMIARYLRHAGYKLFYLQNITDIDDKMIARANELGVGPRNLAKEYEREYYQDMEALGVTSVDKHARATDYIPAIIDQIQRLIDRGYAYATPSGDVFFEVDKFERYGQLSGRSTDEDQQHRIDPDPNKKKPYDFVLWKAQKPGEPAWDSPWGKGRPGWHIEDTAITETEFGPRYDLHGGGLDLKFPHHEAEIAQMEAASGQSPFVLYWLHTGPLMVESEKMSKSLSNFVTVRHALTLANANVWRLLFLRTHYRTPIDYDSDKLQQVKASWERIHRAIVATQRVLESVKCEEPLLEEHALTISARTADEKFHAAMEDDFGTPDALAAIFDLVSDLNRHVAKIDSNREPGDIAAICLASEKVEGLLGILGFSRSLESGSGERPQLVDRLVDLIIDLRRLARTEQRFDLSDEIRERLSEIGVVLEDHRDGTTWRLKD